MVFLAMHSRPHHRRSLPLNHPSRNHSDSKPLHSRRRRGSGDLWACVALEWDHAESAASEGCAVVVSEGAQTFSVQRRFRNVALLDLYLSDEKSARSLLAGFRWWFRKRGSIVSIFKSGPCPCQELSDCGAAASRTECMNWTVSLCRRKLMARVSL